MRGVSQATRTRGSIRTRGAASTETKPMGQLVATLREKARGSPTATIIHGWDHTPAQRFLECLSPLLDGDDAIWLAPADATNPTVPPAEWPGAVVLDFSRDTDARTYANLVVDIVFFHAEEAADAHRWLGRAEAVVISASPEQSAAPIEKVRQSEQAVYLWSDADPDASCPCDARSRINGEGRIVRIVQMDGVLRALHPYQRSPWRHFAKLR